MFILSTIRSVIGVFVICLLFSTNMYGQDTLFIRSLPLNDYVSNISTDGKNLFLRIDNSIYSYSNGKKKYISKGSLRFSWIRKNDYANNYYWYHDEQIPLKYSTSNKKLESILPGPQNSFITTAQLSNNLFICYNGNVLEYKINELTNLVYEGKSIRNIYSDSHLRVVSTYDGVFSQKLFRGKARLFEGENIYPFSHGEFSKIGTDYYLCQSTIVFKYNEEQNELELFEDFKEIGQVRQLIEFENNVIVVFLEGLALLDLVEKKASELLINDKITRAKKIGSELIVVTKTGTIYRVSKELKIDKIQTNFSFEDVQNVNDEIFIGGKSGLFKLNGNELIQLNTVLEFYELHNYKENLIFSNFSGLFAWINSYTIPIVNNIEFNRYAMNHDQLFFYAGSINGLYTIPTGQFDTWLRNQKEKNSFDIENDVNTDSFIINVMLILTILVLIIIVHRYKSKIETTSSKWSKNDFSIDFIESIIRERQIVSVAELADHLKISSVQLNRKLARSGTTGLKILKNTKGKIAKEMHQKGDSLEKISKRTGYSIRFIKENFLK